MQNNKNIAITQIPFYMTSLIGSENKYVKRDKKNFNKVISKQIFSFYIKIYSEATSNYP